MLIACVLLIGCSNHSSEQGAFDTAALQAYVREQMDYCGVPGIQVCIEDDRGKVIARFSSGYMDLPAYLHQSIDEYAQRAPGLYQR
jgi:hypothetical protein